MSKRLLVSSVMALIVLAGLAGGTAGAQPTTPAPAPPGSTSDELADMVMDALQPGSGAPTTTPVAPPRH